MARKKTQKQIKRERIEKTLGQISYKDIKITQKSLQEFCTIIAQGQSELEAVSIAFPDVSILSRDEFKEFMERIKDHRYVQRFFKQGEIQAINNAKSYFRITKNDHIENLLELKNKALSEKHFNLSTAFKIEVKIGEALGFYNHDVKHLHELDMSFKDMINEVENQKIRTIEARPISIEEEPINNDSEIESLPLIK